MKYAPWILLVLASPAAANDREWRRQPIASEEYAEIRRVAQLTPLRQCQLRGVVESERTAFNEQTLMQYNRVLPTPLPLSSTPEVAGTPRRGLRRFLP